MQKGRKAYFVKKATFVAAWYFERRSLFPQISRNRRALRSRILTPCVSRKKAIERIATALTGMTAIHTVHRHPLAAAVKLPTIGATTDPNIGNVVASAIAVPLSSFTKRSPMILGPRVNEAMLNPLKKRKAMSMEIFMLNAEAVRQIVNSTLLM